MKEQVLTTPVANNRQTLLSHQSIRKFSEDSSVDEPIGPILDPGVHDDTMVRLSDPVPGSIPQETILCDEILTV